MALALPETEERDHMGSPSFRVAGKIFAQLSADEDVALLKLSLADQDERVLTRAGSFWLPEHWSKFGWTYLRIADVDPNELRTLLEGSWRAVAPKKLGAGLVRRDD